MLEHKIKQAEHIVCPSCNSNAVYRYGKLSGNQRYICLICNRQFIYGHERYNLRERPICKSCGRKMYIYSRKKDFIRYRCSGYPACKSYLKITYLNQNSKIQEEKDELLHP